MKRTIIVVVALAVSGSLHAQEFVHLGARALGMGGAFVAIADDPTAVYWNPAGLSVNQTRAVSATVAAGGGDPLRTIGDVRSLIDLNLAAHGRIISPADITRALNLLDALSQPGSGVNGEADIDVMFKWGGYAFSVLGLGNAAAVPVINSDILTFDPNSGQPLPTDLPRLNFTGIMTKQYIGSYSTSILENALWVGGNLKLIQADTYYDSRLIVDPQNGSLKLREIVSEATNQNKRGSTTWGIDIGVLGELMKDFRIGLVGRDINGPELPNVGPWKAKLNHQYRLGLSYRIGQVVTLAGDYDLSKNDLGIPGRSMRELSIGGEGRLLGNHLMIRGGVNKNVNFDPARWGFSLGVGFNSPRFGVDVAATTDRPSSQIGGAISGIFRF